MVKKKLPTEKFFNSNDTMFVQDPSPSIEYSESDDATSVNPFIVVIICGNHVLGAENQI